MTWGDSIYKDGDFYRGKKRGGEDEYDWEFILYGFLPQAMGDLIYNTLRMIIETKDTSEWAKHSFLLCTLLLASGRRWPDYMQDGIEHLIAKNWFHQQWVMLKKWGKHRQLYKIWENQSNGIPATNEEIQFIKDNIPFSIHRPQGGVTRDPWIMQKCCAVHLGIPEGLSVKPQLRLYKPKVWQWLRAMNGKRNIYEFLHRFERKKKPDYVKVLDKYMWEYYLMTQIKNDT